MEQCAKCWDYKAIRDRKYFNYLKHLLEINKPYFNNVEWKARDNALFETLLLL